MQQQQQQQQQGINNNVNHIYNAKEQQKSIIIILMGQPRPLFIYLLLFKHTLIFFTINRYVKKCPSSILCRDCQDSNSRPLEHESPPITTRPEQPPSKFFCSQHISCRLTRANIDETSAQLFHSNLAIPKVSLKQILGNPLGKLNTYEVVVLQHI